MKRTKEDALKTKQALIDASLEVFLEKGYSATTLEDIAKKAGVTRGAVYWHFKGKDDFYRELYEREHQLAMELFDKAFNADLPPFEKLRAMVETAVTNFYTNERFSKYIELTAFQIEYATFAKVNNKKTRTNNMTLLAMEKLAASAIKDGVISKKYTAEEIAKTLMLFIVGFYRLKFTAPQFFKNLDDSLIIVRNYLESIKKRDEQNKTNEMNSTEVSELLN